MFKLIYFFVVLLSVQLTFAGNPPSMVCADEDVSYHIWLSPDGAVVQTVSNNRKILNQIALAAADFTYNRGAAESSFHAPSLGLQLKHCHWIVPGGISVGN